MAAKAFIRNTGEALAQSLAREVDSSIPRNSLSLNPFIHMYTRSRDIGISHLTSLTSVHLYIRICVHTTDAPSLQAVIGDVLRWDSPPPRIGVQLGKPLAQALRRCFPELAANPTHSAWAAPYVT
jgi:hypothetical protein